MRGETAPAYQLGPEVLVEESEMVLGVLQVPDAGFTVDEFVSEALRM